MRAPMFGSIKVYNSRVVEVVKGGRGGGDKSTEKVSTKNIQAEGI